MKTIAAPAMAAIEAGEAIVTGAVEIVPIVQEVIPPAMEEGAEVVITWQQSTSEDEDTARMGVRFYDAGGTLLDSSFASLLSSTNGVWTERTHSDTVPADTHFLHVVMEMHRVEGTFNDGWIDGIELTIDGEAVALTNPGAEDGTNGWTVQTGQLLSATSGITPYDGSAFFAGGTASESISYQRYPPLTTTGDAIRLWGGYGPIEIDGDTFQGIGARGLAQQSAGAIGGIAQGLTLTVSGVEPAALELLDADEIRGAPAVLYRMIFASDGKTLLDAHVFDRGRVDTVETDETIGGQATINVAVESAARGLGRSGARRRADSDQRLIDSDDGYFKNTSYAGQKTLYWGGKRPRYGSAG